MENLMGLLTIHVLRGINLAVRDVVSSDPYVVLKMGNQILKTHVVKKSINPVWKQDLTLSIQDPSLPVDVIVYDKDLFSHDDKMGDAKIDIRPFMETVKKRQSNLPNGTILRKIQTSRDNCLAEESCIVWANGQVVQKMFLRLRNVESGEVELQLEWIDIPGSRGL